MALVKLNNRGVRSATTFGSISALGEMRFIKKQTASSSATISFVHGTSDVVLDGTYKEYLFTFKDIHSANDQVHFQFNMSIDAGSNYITTNTFRSTPRSYIKTVNSNHQVETKLACLKVGSNPRYSELFRQKTPQGYTKIQFQGQSKALT